MIIDKRLLQLITPPTRRWIGITTLLGWLVTALNVAQIILIGTVIDRVLRNQSPAFWLLPAFVGIILLRAAAVWGGRQASHRAAAQTKLSLRKRLYAHILKLGPSFLGGQRTGALVNTAVEGVEGLEVYFGQYLPQLILGFTIPILLVGFISHLDGLTALVLLIAQLLIPVSLMVIQRRLRAVSGRFWGAANQLSAQFLDSLQGLPTLKMHNRSQAQGEKIREQSEHLRKDTMRLLAINQVSLFFIDWVSTLGTSVVAIGMAAWRFETGMFTFGEAVILVLLSLELARPLTLLGSFFHAGASGVAAAQHIFEVLKIQPQVDETSRPSLPGQFSPSIQFDNVHFSYETEQERRPALHGLTFDVQPGETVALVGASGAGKSSAVSLLFRFYDPQAGEIRLSGIPLKMLPLGWLREQLALVAQDTYLFYGSIADNLRLAKPDATQTEMEAAARAANIHEFIASLPAGYETQVGERGLSLSGGEAQRIAIARALLKNAPIVILDEATSYVDSENEASIRTSLEHLTAQKTVLMIAHRLSTVRNADRILVMEHGRVIEMGTHADLLKREGAYARLVAAQRIAVGEQGAEYEAQ